MKKILTITLFVFVMLPTIALAQDAKSQPIGDAQDIPADAYYTAQVIEIVNTEYLGTGDDHQLFQDLKVKILSGDEKNKEITIDRVGGLNVKGGRGFKVGDKVVIDKTTLDGVTDYYVQDIYRIPSLIWVTVIFLAVVMIFTRWRGVSSILGLVITIGMIIWYVAPQILAGKNPLAVCLIAASVIAVTSIYLAHGFNKRTSIAVLSTFITLGLAVGLAYAFVHFTKLFGNGSEESIYLQFGSTQNINLQGLLLGGIILGALGVLDDITTAQSATVDELKKANPKASFKQLYAGAQSVGREHISSLINTLFLAYAGVSLPLFLLLVSTSTTPVWATLNSELIAEEIVRTLIGSITLIVAVPITTLLAAYFFSKTGPSNVEGGHHH